MDRDERLEFSASVAGFAIAAYLFLNYFGGNWQIIGCAVGFVLITVFILWVLDQ